MAEPIESQFALRTDVNHAISVHQIMDCTWDSNNSGCGDGEVNQALSSMMN
jgi:hypothetical protein